MTDKTPPRTRRVLPGGWALIAATGLAVTQPALVADFMAPAAHAAGAEAGEGGEGGESGEAGVVRSEGPSAFLTELGYFEGTYLIIERLYRSGERDLARAHLEESHHAIYEDIAPRLAEFGAPAFEAAAARFSDAVTSDASDDAVSEAFGGLMKAIADARRAADLSPHEQLISIKDLLTLAHAEYEGGAEAGTVDIPIEYRDAWGFYETARLRAVALAAEPDTARAGQALLERLEGLGALFPSLTATQVSDDPSGLAAAAGWAEIIALRQD